MCAVSAITNGFYQQWPKPQQFPFDMYPDYLELRRKAALYDEMNKQRDCPEPEKAKWHEELVKFMREKYGFEPK